jgi:8-oxo-dGTP diphosphatase
VVKNKKILLVKERGKNWETPGGVVEKGETLEGALRREIKEETGYDVDLKNFFFVSYKKFSVKFYNLHIFYKASLKSKISEPEKEIEEIKWFDAKELEELIEKNEVDYHDVELFKHIINQKLV